MQKPSRNMNDLQQPCWQRLSHDVKYVTEVGSSKVLKLERKRFAGLKLKLKKTTRIIHHWKEGKNQELLNQIFIDQGQL